MWWKRTKPETIKIETPYGEFFKRNGGDTWDGQIQNAHGNSIEVLADDIDGVPNPRLLDLLPTILADLQGLDRIARSYSGLSEYLSTEYELTLITDCTEETATSYPDCFTLGYSQIDDGGGEGYTIFVHFSGRDVVSGDVGH